MSPVVKAWEGLLQRFQREAEQKQAAYQAKREAWTETQLQLRAEQYRARLRILGDDPPPGLSVQELGQRLGEIQELLRQKARVQLAFDLEQAALAAASGAQPEPGPVPPEPPQPPGLEQVSLRPEELRHYQGQRQDLLERALEALVPGQATVEVLAPPLGSARVPGAQWVSPVEAPGVEQPSPPDRP